MTRVALVLVGLAILGLFLFATGGAERARATSVVEEAPPPTPPGEIERLAADLRGPDPDLRVEAAVALRALGEAAVPVFLDLLRSGDAHGRALAARSLGRMGRAATAAVPALADALADPALRPLAVEALAAIGDRAAIGPLLPLLRDADPAVVLATLRTLRSLKPDTPEAALAIAGVIDPARWSDAGSGALQALEAMGPAALPALPTLLLAFESPGLLSPAIDAVGAIGPAASHAIPALAAVIVAENERKERELAEAFESGELQVVCGHGPYPTLDASDALASIGEAAIPQVLALLAHDSDRVRSDARRTLAMMGDFAVPYLADAAGNPDARVREGAALAFLVHAEGHPELLDALVRLSHDPDTDVRKTAIESLGAYGAAAAPAVLAALEETDPEILVAALQAFRGTVPRDPSVVPRLVTLLDHGHYQVRWCAADAIAAMGEAGAVGFPALARCLGDEDSYMRQTAREALAKLGSCALPSLLAAVDRAPADAQRGTLLLLAAERDLTPEGLDACRRLLVAADEGVRAQAASVLVARGARDDTLLPLLVAGLAHADMETRKAVNTGLAALGDAAAPLLPEILRAVVREGERENNEVYFFDALAAAGKSDPGALVRALSDESWDLRYAAQVALAQIGEPAVAPLAKALSSAGLDARQAAAEVLGKLAKGSAAARAALEGARADPDLRFAALVALWQGTHDARAVLEGLLDEALAGTPQSETAAYHLSTMGSNAAFALEDLRAARAAAKDKTVRAYLAQAIEAVETR